MVPWPSLGRFWPAREVATAFQLSAETFSSASTLRTEFTAVKSRLHDFDLALSWHVAHQLDQVLCGETCPRLAALVDPDIVEYAAATAAASSYQLVGPELLFSQFDLEHIAQAMAFAGREPNWMSYPQVLQLWRDAVPEIRSGLGQEQANDWWSISMELEARLLDETRFMNAVDVVNSWTDEVRGLLRGLGLACFVPAPDGEFPCPRRPQRLPLAASSSNSGSNPVQPPETPSVASRVPQDASSPGSRGTSDRPPPPSPYLDSTDAARYLRISLKSLYAVVERRRLVPLRGPRNRYRFTRELLDEYLARERSH